MHVDISCQKCGQRKRMDIGMPKTAQAGQTDQPSQISENELEEYLSSAA